MHWLLNRWVIGGVVAVLILVGAWAKGYSSGKASVRAEWDQEIASRTQQALALEQAARAKERSLLAAKHDVEARYVDLKAKQARSAAGAQRELARLRDQLSAASSTPTGDTTGQPGVDGASIPGEFLGSCAEALTGMAEEADEIRARLIGLQGYVRGVCERSSVGQGNIR